MDESVGSLLSGLRGQDYLEKFALVVTSVDGIVVIARV